MSAHFDIRVDRNKCCASGQCVMSAPDVFDQSSEDGRVLLLVAKPDDSRADAVHEAVECCPAGAITITERTE
jgi:ferredoxin